MADTKFIQANMNNQKLKPPMSLDFEGIYYVNGESLEQRLNHTTFSTVSGVKLGNTVTCDVKFNSKHIELEKEWYVYFTLSTADATNHPRFFNDCYTIIDQVELTLNDGSEKWKYEEPWMIELQRSTELKEKVKNRSLSEWRAKSDIDWNGLTGVQVTDAAAQPFYFDLFAMFPRLRNTVMNNFIDNMQIKIRFRASPSTVAEACRICQSNTTSNAYNSQITINDVKFYRVFDIIRDPKTYLRPPLGDVIFPIARYERVPVENISWNVAGTDKYSFSIHEKFKNPFMQSIIAYVEDIGVAYNDSNAQKKFSGHAYIKWSIAEQDGDRKEMNFTSTNTQFTSSELTRFLRAYEIQFQENQYGEHLPLSCHTNSDDTNKYLVNMTEIPMNNIKIHDQAFDYISQYNSALKYYNVVLECAGAVSANCNIWLIAKYYDLYKLDGQRRLVKIN